MLRANDSLALFCTGSCSPSKHEPEQVSQLLKQQHQLNAVYGPETYRHFPAKERAEIFLDHLFNSDVKALWALRGGEGTADTLPFIHEHRDRIAKLKPKPIIGFSDITALLVYFAQQYQWPVVHGPGALQMIHTHLANPYKQQVIDYLFTGEVKPLKLTPFNQVAKQVNLPQGKWIGGNLSLLNISIGDLWEIETKSKIVLIEEVNEAAHAVRRTLNYLDRLGKFTQAKAIVLGEFSLKGNPSQQLAAIRRALQQFADQQSIPIYRTNQVGHGSKNQLVCF